MATSPRLLVALGATDWERHWIMTRWLGRFVAWMAILWIGAWQPSAFAEEQGGVSLNFRDTDIRLIIESVAKITRHNIIIDPRVNANVTIISEDTVAANDLYDTLLFLLSIYGYEAVDGEYATVILPSSNASRVPKAARDPKAPRIDYETVTEIITVNNVPAASVTQVLQPFFAGSTTRILVVPNSNRIIITGPRLSIAHAKRIIASVDRLSVSDYDIIPLRYAASNEMLSLLQTVFGGNNSTLKLQAEARTNRIIIVSDSLQTRLAVRAIVADLDKPVSSSEQGNLRVFYLKYAKAEELAPTLTSLLSSSAFGKLGVSVQGANGQNTQNNAANKTTPPATGGKTDDKVQFSLVADKALNSIVVVGDNNVIRTVQSLIQQLDIPRRQVAIELIIAEVSDSLNESLGVDFFSTKGGFVVSNLTEGGGLGQFAKGGSSGALGSSAAAVGAAASGGSGVTAGIVHLTSGHLSWGALFQAIDSDSNSRILATPFVTVMDNQEAHLSVGEERPFVTGKYTQTGSSSSISSPFQTITRKNVGIEFTIKPQINSGDTINLDVDEEVSSVKDSADQSNGVVTSVRKIKTNIMTNNSEIIAMGGLTREDNGTVVHKVPILGDIPLIGLLFSYHKKTEDRRSLVVFIRPKIISSNREINTYSRGKYEQLASGLVKSTNQTISEIRDYFTKPATPTETDSATETLTQTPKSTTSKTTTRPFSRAPLADDRRGKVDSANPSKGKPIKSERKNSNVGTQTPLEPQGETTPSSSQPFRGKKSQETSPYSKSERKNSNVGTQTPLEPQGETTPSSNQLLLNKKLDKASPSPKENEKRQESTPAKAANHSAVAGKPTNLERKEAPFASAAPDKNATHSQQNGTQVRGKSSLPWHETSSVAGSKVASSKVAGSVERSPQ